MRARCEKCGHEVEFLAPDQIEPVLEEVARPECRPSRKRFHLEQAKDGLVVCLQSLVRFLGTASGRRIFL